MKRGHGLLLRISLLMHVLAVVSPAPMSVMSSHAQLSTSPEYYYARYRINGSRPDGFAEVAYLVLGVRHSPSDTRREEENVKYDEHGNALIKGEVWTENGISYPFQTAKLSRSTTLRRDGCGLFTNLNLVTESKEGISYRFDGEFLQEPERLGKGNYTDLRGVFTKFKNGFRRSRRPELISLDWVSSNWKALNR